MSERDNDLQEEFDAYKEGSEHAFGVVVQKCQDLEKNFASFEKTIQAQQGVIVTMRTQRNELLGALNGLMAYFESGIGLATGRAVIKLDSLEVRAAYAAIAKAKGGAA